MAVILWPLLCLFVVLIVVFGVLRLLIWLCTRGPSSPPSSLRRQVSKSSSSAGFRPSAFTLPHSHPHLYPTAPHLPLTATYLPPRAPILPPRAPILPPRAPILPLSGTYLPSTPTNSSTSGHICFSPQEPPVYDDLLPYQPSTDWRQLDVSQLPTYQEVMQAAS